MREASKRYMQENTKHLNLKEHQTLNTRASAGASASHFSSDHNTDSPRQSAGGTASATTRQPPSGPATQ
eukprot:1353450-Pyramimonas_sp.AAC.1